MNDEAREKLRELIMKYGTSICDEPKRCEGLLKDVCGSYRREVNVLILALKERIPAELFSINNEVPFEILSSRLVLRLQDNLCLAEDASRWAVESWALALGYLNKETIHKSYEVPTEVKNETSSASIDLASPDDAIAPTSSWFQERIKLALTIGAYGAIGGVVGGLLGGVLEWVSGNNGFIFFLSIIFIPWAILTGFYHTFGRRLFTLFTIIEVLSGVFGLIVIGYIILIIRAIFGWSQGMGGFLGAILGLLLSFRIPNLNRFGCLLGGTIGAIPIILNQLNMIPSNTVIPIILQIIFGFAFGYALVMIDVVFSKAWLVIDHQSGKHCLINLGPNPVKVGSDRRRCHIGIQGAPSIAYQYFFKNHEVYCKDESSGLIRPVSAGDEIRIGDARITVGKK